MPCLCTTNTLRIFVRNVAQVDLPHAARFVASNQLPRRHIPALSQAHASRPYSVTKLRHRELLPDARSEQVRPNRWPQEDDNMAGQLSYVDAEGAVVDLSPEAIDAIAAESTAEASQRIHYASNISHKYGETPLKSILKDMPKKTTMHQVSGTVFRRGRSENSSFKLHYSAPPDWEKIEEHGERVKDKRAKMEEAAKDDWVPPPREPWMVAKERAKEKYPDGYLPLKRLSPDAIAGIRALHAQMPEQYTTATLAEEFKVSPEAIMRILKSKWTPTPKEQTDREKRWFKRGERVWTRLADLGTKPPKQWRELGIGAGKPEWMQRREAPRIQRAPLPALITTARRRQEVRVKSAREDSLADRII
ncbi:hypothetical protein EG329_000517 [Mollisiaceae sp. DMI_Dod_QoI]|nr:hypothetical protein EG329_000517 [Helotiales sp. DMI_Dod_QoI]